MKKKKNKKKIRVASAVKKDLMTPKYKARVVKSKKGKGSFKRSKKVVNE